MVLGEVVKGRVISVQCARTFPIPKPGLWREKKSLLESHLPRGRSFLKHEPPPTAFQSYLKRGEEKLRNICQGHSPGIQNIMGLTLPHTLPSYLQSFKLHVVTAGNS